jgi:hypothetical protein
MLRYSCCDDDDDDDDDDDVGKDDICLGNVIK